MPLRYDWFCIRCHFPMDEYVLEVGQRRVVLRFKGHERVVFSYVYFCFSVPVLSFCLRK